MDIHTFCPVMMYLPPFFTASVLIFFVSRPVFGSVTKSTGYDRVGLVMVGEAARRGRSRGLPIVAIGGITLFTAPSVIDAGAASVAVIGDLLTTGDPASRVREYLRALG